MSLPVVFSFLIPQKGSRGQDINLSSIYDLLDSGTGESDGTFVTWEGGFFRPIGDLGQKLIDLLLRISGSGHS